MGLDQATDYEAILHALQALSREEIAEQVARRVSCEDAQSFRVLVEGLSLDALRVVSARALWRLRRAAGAEPMQP